VRGYAVKGEIRGRTRLEVSRERGLTALVGREPERQRLTSAFRRTSDGAGGVVLIAGDAGVGKSRLLYELLRSLEANRHLELETTCVSYGHAMAYRPVMELYRGYLGLPEGVSPEEIRRLVTERLEWLHLNGEEPAILLAHFLGAPAPPEFLLRVQGAQLKARTNDLLASVLVRESERAPVVLVVENVHWIDASSEEFLKLLADRVQAHAVLLVLTTRPGPSMDWLPASTETIRLEGLDTEDVRGMVHALLGTRDVAVSLWQILIDKGAGNPLYFEEILRQLQETGGIHVEEGEARLRTTALMVPETIRDIIASRVDRLVE
jgi:predicted ATPase